MPHDSLPELELANVRTREALTDTVADLRRATDLRARTRLGAARLRQQLHRNPTPIVAMGALAAAGAVAIAVGGRIGRSNAGHLEPAPKQIPVRARPRRVVAVAGAPAESQKDIKRRQAKRRKQLTTQQKRQKKLLPHASR